MLIGFSGDLNAQDAAKPVSEWHGPQPPLILAKLNKVNRFGGILSFRIPPWSVDYQFCETYLPLHNSRLSERTVQPGKSGKIAVTFNAASSGMLPSRLS